MSLRKDLTDEFGDELLFLSGEMFDDAIIGISTVPAVVYDATVIIDILINSGMTEEEAIDYCEDKINNSDYGEHTPVFMYRLDINSRIYH